MRGRAAWMLAGMICCGLVVAAPCLGADLKLSPEERAAAEKAAADWLALTDRGEHAAALRASSRMFQSTIKPESWTAFMIRQREPLGVFVGRTAFSTAATTTALSFPPGRYCFVKYLAEYENGSINERVIVVSDETGKWRMCGYRMTPRGAPTDGPSSHPEPASGASPAATRSPARPSSPAVGTITIKPPKSKSATGAQ